MKAPTMRHVNTLFFDILQYYIRDKSIRIANRNGNTVTGLCGG